MVLGWMGWGPHGDSSMVRLLVGWLVDGGGHPPVTAVAGEDILPRHDTPGLNINAYTRTWYYFFLLFFTIFYNCCSSSTGLSIDPRHSIPMSVLILHFTRYE